MGQFLRPNKSKLKNAQHFSFIEAFLTLMNQQGFTAAKITALLAQLQEAFQEEDRWYMIARSSELIAQRDEADRRRDGYYARIHAIIRAWAGSSMEVFDAAATRLKKKFDLYKVKTSAQMDEETGQLDNLIRDLSTEQMQADLTALSLAWMYQQMVEAHEQVKSIRLEEGTEVSEKVPGALAAARKACDKIYDELTYLIEAFSLTADDPAPYETFITKWNGTLKIYQDMLDRKSAANKDKDDKKDDDGDKPEPKPDEGGDDEGGDDEGGGGDDPTPTPDPDPTPTPDPSGGGDGDDDTDGKLPE